MFGLMIKRGLEPDVVSYNALMNGWCLRGCVSEAKEVLDRMVERGKSPNVISYSTLINGYC